MIGWTVKKLMTHLQSEGFTQAYNAHKAYEPNQQRLENDIRTFAILFGIDVQNIANLNLFRNRVFFDPDNNDDLFKNELKNLNNQSINNITAMACESINEFIRSCNETGDGFIAMIEKEDLEKFNMELNCLLSQLTLKKDLYPFMKKSNLIAHQDTAKIMFDFACRNTTTDFINKGII